MTGLITRSLAPKHLEVDLLNANVAAFKSARRDLARVFKSYKSTKSKEETVTMEPLGYASEIPEGAAIDFDAPAQGYTQTYVPVKHGLGVKVTEEMLDDNQYPKVFANVRDLGRVSADTQEAQRADVFNDAISGSTYLAGDGNAIGDNTHDLPGGTTYDNLVTAAALSHSTLMSAVEMIRKHKTGRGVPLNLGFGKFTLIVPVDLEETAWTLKNSAGLTGTANNDRSQLATLDWEFIVSPWLTSTTAWFVLTPDHDFTWINRKPARVSREGDWDSGSVKFKTTWRAARGINETRGIAVCAGA